MGGKSVLRTLTVAGLIVLGLIGCSSSSKSTSGSGSSDKSTTTTTTTPRTGSSSAPVSAVFHGTADWNGALDLNGSYDAQHRSEVATLRSCAQIASAKGPKAFFVVPSPTKLGNYDVALLAAVLPYNGPGTYDVTKFSQLQASARPTLTKDFQVFDRSTTTKATLIVKPDASGSFTFSNLRDSKGKMLSGTMSWTCSKG